MLSTVRQRQSPLTAATARARHDCPRGGEDQQHISMKCAPVVPRAPPWLRWTQRPQAVSFLLRCVRHEGSTQAAEGTPNGEPDKPADSNRHTATVTALPLLSFLCPCAARPRSRALFVFFACGRQISSCGARGLPFGWLVWQARGAEAKQGNKGG
jgi:hypothetical protein